MTEFLSAEYLALIPAMWIYCGLFLVALFEGAPVLGSFLPGGTTIIAVGTVAGVGIIDPIWAVVIGAFGSIMGDIVGFFILRLHGRRIKILRKVLDSIQYSKGWLTDVFDKRYFVITILARLIPFARVATSVAAAGRNISVWGYILATVLASTLWAASGILIGYGLVEFIPIKYIMFGLIAFCVGSLVWGSIKYIRKQKIPTDSRNTLQLAAPEYDL